MRSILSSIKTPPMAVAFVALLAALGGTAVALPGSNVVTSGDITNGAVKTQDIRNSTVRGRDVRNNTLTGSDVNESRLGTVPAASRAGSANSASIANLAGSAVSAGSLASQRKLNYHAAADSGPRVIYNSGRLVLTADCDSGDLTLDATTSVDNANVQSYGTSADTQEVDFDTGDTLTFSESTEERDLVYSEPGGQIVVMQYIAIENSGIYNGTADCAVKGVAQAL